MADQSAKVPTETREPRFHEAVAGRTLLNRWSGIPLHGSVMVGLPGLRWSRRIR